MKPNRILVALLSAIVFAGSFLYLTETALALDSPYPGRKYVHDQWFRVFVKVGTNQEKLINTNWRPVFDIPETLGSGYTADEPSEINKELASYLQSAKMYDEKNNMYLLSASGAQEIGQSNEHVERSDWIKNIPIRSTSNAAEIRERVGNIPLNKAPGATKKEPNINYNEPPSSVVWDGSKFYYALSTSPVDGEYRGIKNLQINSDAHRAFVNPAQAAKVGYGELHLRFPYNTIFVEHAPIVWGHVEAGKTIDGLVHVANLAPWGAIPAKTQFRVYIQEQGKDPVLVDDTKSLKLEPYSSMGVPFNFPIPNKKFKLILTVNMHWDGKKWVEEPLSTLNPFGDNVKPVVERESEYVRNKIEKSFEPDAPSIPVEEEENNQPANLSVTSLQILTKDGSPASGTLEVNKSYKVRATFKSTFDFSGKAKVRFYIKREKGYMDLREESNVTFGPNGTVEKTWDIVGGTENRTLIATVAYREVNGNWVKELFNEDHMETTYDDNKKEIATQGTESPDVMPTPGGFSYSLYYHPVREVMVPVYEQRKVYVYKQEWVEIPFYPAPDSAQLRSRLVPTPAEEEMIKRKGGQVKGERN